MGTQVAFVHTLYSRCFAQVLGVDGKGSVPQERGGQYVCRAICSGSRAHLAAVQDLAIAGAATPAAEVHVAVAVVLCATCRKTGSMGSDGRCGLWAKGEGSRRYAQTSVKLSQRPAVPDEEPPLRRSQRARGPAPLAQILRTCATRRGLNPAAVAEQPCGRRNRVEWSGVELQC